MSISKTKNRLINLSLVLISTMATLLVLEIALRFIAPHNMYHSLVPSIDVDRDQESGGFFPGIATVSHFSVNEYGYRSPSKFSENRYGILAIGGSTTQCISLSDDESWPWVLENMLNQSSSSVDFTVGNIGVPAFNAGNHFHQLKHIEPQFENIKMVVMLVGINDFARVLFLGDNFFPTSEDKHLYNRSFIRLPRKGKPHFYQRTELYMHLRDKYNQYRSNRIPFTPDLLDTRVREYNAAIKSDSLPDMTIALDDYERNLRNIAKLSKERNLRLVLITQPVLWNKDMNAFEEKISSMGAPVIDGIAYSPIALEKGMEIFNNRLRKVAEDERVDVIDLSRQLPQDTSAFYDWCHYTVQGATEVARILHEDLKPILNESVWQNQKPVESLSQSDND